MKWEEYNGEGLNPGESVLAWTGTEWKEARWETWCGQLTFDDNSFGEICTGFFEEGEVTHIMRVSPPEGYLGSNGEGGVE